MYRNLHKNNFSIRQGGLVVAHCQHISLNGARAHVGLNGREQVRRTKSKLVHAWISGYVTGHQVHEGTELRYSPYDDVPGFHVDGEVKTDLGLVTFDYPNVLIEKEQP